MSTREILSKLFNFTGGVLPKKKAVSQRSVNRVLDISYRTAVNKNGLRRNRLHKRTVVYKAPDLSEDFLNAFNNLGLTKRKTRKTHKKKPSADTTMAEPSRRSGRHRTQPDRWSPTSAAKKDKENARKSRKAARSPKRRTPSPLGLNFMNLRL